MDNSTRYTGLMGLALALMFSLPSAHATVDGITGPVFNLTAKVDSISTADGGSLLIWGYSDDDNKAGFGTRAQYPGPTLIVNQGDTVTINLKNSLSVSAGTVPPVSMVFPGQQVTAACTTSGTDGCPDGLLTMEAENDGDVVSYTFVASQPGTYAYYSGTDQALQVEMGLTGALIVRPSVSGQAYSHADSAYDYEYLFFVTEMDPRIHYAVAASGPAATELDAFFDNYRPNYWFFNGRTAPDNFNESYISWLPTQPYNLVPRMHPGDRLLMRVVNGGRDTHPFHHHGNHSRIIARDGRMLSSVPGVSGADISTKVYTIPMVPGETVDAIFEWTGKGLNWDIYGGTDVNLPHTCNGKPVGVDQDPGAPEFDPVTREYCADHGKPFPVVLPEQLDLGFGGWWGGSPYLGLPGSLPPGEGGLNPNGAFIYMWHSHTERELTNYDIFPGGMLTMLVIEAPGVPID
ncbi:multicopper oxidase domain-containing protein [Thiolapillus sp.]